MMGAYQYEKRAEKQEQQEQVTLAEQTDTAETQNTTNADDTQETMVTQKPDQQTENTVSNQADSSAWRRRIPCREAQTRRQYISRYRPMKNRCCTLRRQIPLAGRWRAM